MSLKKYEPQLKEPGILYLWLRWVYLSLLLIFEAQQKMIQRTMAQKSIKKQKLLMVKLGLLILRIQNLVTSLIKSHGLVLSINIFQSCLLALVLLLLIKLIKLHQFTKARLNLVYQINFYLIKLEVMLKELKFWMFLNILTYLGLLINTKLIEILCQSFINTDTTNQLIFKVKGELLVK